MATYGNRKRNKRVRLSTSSTSFSDDLFSNDEIPSPSESFNKSPKKFISVRTTLEKDTSVKNLTQTLLNIADPPKEEKKVPKEKSKVKRKPKSVPRSTTKKSKPNKIIRSNAWDDLFNSIEEQPVIILANEQSSASEESETETNEVSFEIDFDSICKETTPTQPEPKRIVPKPQPKQKTYASDRTYLLDDNVELHVKQELTNEISSRHDFDNCEAILNVNDLRSSSNGMNTLYYILDGLSGTRSVLVSSLLELLVLVQGKISQSDLNKVVLAVKEIRWSDDIVVKLVSSVCYRVCTNHKEVLAQLESVLDKVILGLSTVIEITKFSRVNQNLAKPYLEPCFDIGFLREIQKQNLVNWPVILAILELLESSQRNNTDLLEILEVYFQDSKLIGLDVEKLTPLFEESFLRLDQDKNTEFDSRIIRVFIVLTTNYEKKVVQEIYDSKWTHIIFGFLDRTYRDANPESLSLCLLLLGLLMNLVEWDLIEVDVPIIANNMAQLEALDNQHNNEIKSYIIGYNAIVLSHLQIKYSSQLTINRSKLKTWLTQFQPTAAISGKVYILLQSI
ncbi:uncharacterized protein SPAPADRAFT_51346 [Spathaspora passalidarum NRRL Y-27907]|uniref:Wings apart-like protein C-terminal domain-containing protein n=1 Tax=Spathaspora passalidarum (strain NRRL Y-27907 / 11-Y1) TaxID=619300 RepID=G3ARK5_SPAPN|nr:uncharacterized protein SPAPADRAFT_51346 [Spathaspora passalidarum NRRL Y-27907]EGW31326.1 hypothetical protein SPAPADRAFT_51346 [Spathaspora passalidarum NRRL Y-27907]